MDGWIAKSASANRNNAARLVGFSNQAQERASAVVRHASLQHFGDYPAGHIIRAAKMSHFRMTSWRFKGVVKRTWYVVLCVSENSGLAESRSSIWSIEMQCPLLHRR